MEPAQSSVNPPQPPMPRPVTPELPHLIVDEPKRGMAGVLGIVVLSLMLLGIPLGIFLVSQRTQLAPQAAVTEKQPEVISGVFLESKLSSVGDVIPVNVYVKSPLDAVNLVNAKITYDPSMLSFEKIATGAAELNQPELFNEWVEVNFDNDKGSASIIAGLPTPGLRTGGGNDEKVYLATLNIKPKKSGTTVLQVTSGSELLRNSDNQNILTTGNDLALNLSMPSSLEVPLPSPSPSKAAKPDEESLIVITSPVAATNYSYFKPIAVNWSSFNVEGIAQINLLINGQLFGPIAQNLEASSGQFSWQPKDNLAIHNVQPSNTYTLEIVGVSKDGILSKAVTAPFGILGTEDIGGSPPNPEAFAQNQLKISDVSVALSSYLLSPPKDASMDLNKDGVINNLDLFLIRQNLLTRAVIK